MILRFGKLNKWVNTGIAILFLIVAITIGLNAPVFLPQSSWRMIVFFYILVASVVPIWALLQPRDYLNSYLLVAMIVAAVIGVFTANPQINLPAFTSFTVKGQPMFPILFVTIACGAVSGFHSLVSSGTSSKQIKSERHMLPISFGAMLMESLLAVISLIAVASFAAGAAAEQGYVTPPQVFAGAIAGFLTTIGLPKTTIFTLINLAVSAFALTSLDSVARVGRLSFQELFQQSDDETEKLGPARTVLTNKYFATVATLLFAYFLCRAGYSAIWPLFGSANQLLSALAFIACAVFLKRTHRAYGMLYVPIFFMMGVTFTALVIKIVQLLTALSGGTSASLFNDGLQLVFAVLVLGLGVCVAIQGISSLYTEKRRASRRKPGAAASPDSVSGTKTGQRKEASRSIHGYSERLLCPGFDLCGRAGPVAHAGAVLAAAHAAAVHPAAAGPESAACAGPVAHAGAVAQAVSAAVSGSVAHPEGSSQAGPDASGAGAVAGTVAVGLMGFDGFQDGVRLLRGHGARLDPLGQDVALALQHFRLECARRDGLVVRCGGYVALGKSERGD